MLLMNHQLLHVQAYGWRAERKESSYLAQLDKNGGYYLMLTFSISKMQQATSNDFIIKN